MRLNPGSYRSSLNLSRYLSTKVMEKKHIKVKIEQNKFRNFKRKVKYKVHF